MGGNESSATPTTPPGYTGGSVEGYTPPPYSPSPVQPEGFDWSVFGKAVNTGFQNAAQGLQGGGGIPSFAASPMTQTQLPASEPTSIQRIEPDTGAGKFWYVDPKAGKQSFDPMDYYNQSVSDDAATEALKDSLKKIGLLSAGESANPSF